MRDSVSYLPDDVNGEWIKMYRRKEISVEVIKFLGSRLLKYNMQTNSITKKYITGTIIVEISYKKNVIFKKYKSL